MHSQSELEPREIRNSSCNIHGYKLQEMRHQKLKVTKLT